MLGVKKFQWPWVKHRKRIAELESELSTLTARLGDREAELRYRKADILMIAENQKTADLMIRQMSEMPGRLRNVVVLSSTESSWEKIIGMWYRFVIVMPNVQLTEDQAVYLQRTGDVIYAKRFCG